MSPTAKTAVNLYLTVEKISGGRLALVLPPSTATWIAPEKCAERLIESYNACRGLSDPVADVAELVEAARDVMELFSCPFQPVYMNQIDAMLRLNSALARFGAAAGDGEGKAQ